MSAVTGREGGLSSADIFRKEGGVFRCGRSHFLVQKSSDFLKFMVCLHGKGGEGVEPVRAFFGQGGGNNFSRFFSDVFHARPLMVYIYSS